ncbi:LOW QUALITY PROTEIN: protein FAM227A [Mantella aurantiaca]
MVTRDARRGFVLIKGIACGIKPLNPFMDSINRLSSPMALCVEDFTEPPLEQEKRKESIRKAVRSFQAPFLIGSMEGVSKKIEHLEEEIRAFGSHDLMIESSELYGRISPHEHQTPYHKVTGSSILKKSEQIKDRERKDLQRFTQEFQMSMRNMKSAVYQQSYRSTNKKANSMPKLVELYQFPQYVDEGPTPLPYETALSTIISNVVSSHKKRGGMILPPRKLWGTLTTPLVQEIVLDCFWWIFLHMYKPDAECQRKLFDRVAQDYVRLLDLCQKLPNGDALLNIFPSFLSQTIYSSFCFSFPQSVHQFQSDDFKTQLCSVLWQWFGGICPTPRCYNSWDFDALEPKDDMSHKKEKQKDSSFFDLYPSKERASVTTSYRPRKQKCRPAFCEPEFTSMAFNLNGNSPLMQYYLKMQKAELEAGLNIFVRRTELQKQVLPLKSTGDKARDSVPKEAHELSLGTTFK